VREVASGGSCWPVVVVKRLMMDEVVDIQVIWQCKNVRWSPSKHKDECGAGKMVG
jgi:hypothetical protein